MRVPASLALVAMSPLVCAIDQQRALFEDAVRRLESGSTQAASELLQGLDGYPLRPYLAWRIIERDLRTVALETVAAFLDAHDDLPDIASYRASHAHELARRSQWQALADAYVDDETLPVGARCRVAEAMHRTGRNDDAWSKVDALWPRARSLPEECDDVLAAWRAAGQLDAERIWQRLEAAVPARSAGLVRYLRKLLSAAERPALDRWLELRRAPQQLPASAARFELTRERDARIALDVLTHHARKAPRAALASWRKLSARAAPPRALRLDAESRIGVALARRGVREAFALIGPDHSDEAQQARAELAIELGEWERLLESVTHMGEDAAGHGRWRYWHGRARQLLGGTPGERFASLARERGYYAFLAADRLEREYNMAPQPIVVDTSARRELEAQPAVARITELTVLRRAAQARREWGALLARLDRDGRVVAARVASDRGWDALAIFAAGRAQAWDDLALRFPLTHREQVMSAANTTGLDAEEVFAIIRQESAFMIDARSSAGALGVMQLMPATARGVARRLAQPRPSATDLMSPQRNIVLGSHYLAELYSRYRAHPVLAAAAYNAGPGNVARWRPTERSLPSELWIEQIPFKETRDYVRRVLAYRAIYRFRLGVPQRRISSWMPPVAPAGS